MKASLYYNYQYRLEFLSYSRLFLAELLRALRVRAGPHSHRICIPMCVHFDAQNEPYDEDDNVVPSFMKENQMDTSHPLNLGNASAQACDITKSAVTDPF